jgi:hypothetical protein
MPDLPKDLAAAWAKANANLGMTIPVGRTVVCDSCSEDFTDSPLMGGFIFGSYGICPKCSQRWMRDIAKNHEEEHIIGFAKDGEAFGDFVRRMRGPDASIRITTAVGP